MIPALVGLFAISEAFLIIESESILSQRGRELMIKSGWFGTVEGVRLGSPAGAHHLDQHHRTDDRHR